MKKKSHHTKYHRIILKLSGEFFGSQQKILSEPALQYVAEQIISARELGARIGVIVGAGNIIRGREAQWFNKIDADLCGMMGTVINGLTLCSLLKKNNHDTKISSALAIDGVAERFNRYTDLLSYNSGSIVVFVGGTGNPLFTTDTAAALRAAEMNADVLIKGTKVAGVYSSDPHTDKNATFYEELTYDQVIDRNLQIMDLAAFDICRKAKIPIYVYDFMKYKLADIISGSKKVGTIIGGG